jgi:DNA-binding response OmpR family regulator
MNPSVLVVEDYRDIAFPLLRTPEREGYTVTWVDSGQQD